MAKERLFFTGSTRIINDARPSGLDLRVYACVSLHDGMSLKKGSGRGCYATYATLTAAIVCDTSNLSKSLKRLVEWGYLTEERQDDRRRKTYRVVFDFPEGWQNDQQSKVGEIANNAATKDGQAANEIVGNGDSRNGSNPPEDEQHYSSLKGLDSLEREKLDSSEEALSSKRKTPVSENDGAQLAMFERAWKASAYTVEQLIEWHAWLQPFADDPDPDDANNQRANRLFFDVDLWLWENQAGPHATSEAAERKAAHG